MSNRAPLVFSVFELPPDRRLAAMRKALDEGANPSSLDPLTSKGESLLGRALSIGKGQVDMQLVQLLLDAGANPLKGHTWVDEAGDMEPLFQHIAQLSLEDVTIQGHANPSVSLTPQFMPAFLKACLDHGHRNAEGDDALAHMVQSLRPFSNAHYLHPIRDALAMGFSINQPMGHQPNAVHYLVRKYSLSATQTSMAPTFDAAWEFIADFIDAGIDMQVADSDGRTGWDAIAACANQPCNELLAYQRIKPLLQSQALQATTPKAPRASSARRV